MYRLTVVAGPNSGQSYKLDEGENSIGRQMGNVIVLSSSKVSKRHCTLVVSNGEIVLKDSGSANGTFVNGVLTKSRTVHPGDRISVGDFVFELGGKSQELAPVLEFSRPPARTSSSKISGTPIVGMPITGMQSQEMLNAELRAEQAPKSPVERVTWLFEKYVMPIFYSLNTKTEWRSILIILLLGFVCSSILISIYPLLQSSELAIAREGAKRARALAEIVAEQNAPALAQGIESKTSIGNTDKENSVRFVMLTDLDNRVIAPAKKANQYLAAGAEATFATKAAEAFKAGRETGISKQVSGKVVVGIEPVKVFDNRLGKNVTVAMAIASIDISFSTPDAGEIGIIYAKTFLLMSLLGAFFFFVIYRLTLKRFEMLNEDIDKALKGEGVQIARDFKLEELNQLWDAITSAVQRLPRDSGGIGGMGGGAESLSAQELESLGMAMDHSGPMGFALCDANRGIIKLSMGFEEITGIRAADVLGQDLTTAARDEAFGAMLSHLFEQASGASGAIGDDFEFSGVGYRVDVLSLGSSGQRPFLVTVKRK